MESLVPFIGEHAPDKNDALRDTVRFIVEEKLGHKIYFVDDAVSLLLRKVNPLQLLIPFTVGTDKIAPVIRNDILDQIHRLYPSAPHIEASLELIPNILTTSKERLSLGHAGVFPDFVRDEVKLIYKNLARSDYKLSEIAHDIGLSKSTLERRNNKIGEFGISHLQFEIRMMEARRMVIETREPISEIAFAVGYENLSIFDRAFQRAWNCSPRELRRNANTLRQKAN